MKHHTSLALLMAVAVAACSTQTPEQRLIRDAASALGGAERILAVRTLVIEGEGTHHNLGQDLLPGAAGQTFQVTRYRRAIDVPGERARTELERVPKFTFWQGLRPQIQVQGIDKAVGYNVAPNGSASRTAAAAADDRRAELLRHPISGCARGARPRGPPDESAHGAWRAERRCHDGRWADVHALGRRGTKLPSRVAAPANNVNLGDVIISTAFAEYADVAGLKLPTRLTTRTDEFVTAEVRVTTQTVDADAGDLAAPAAVASAAPPAVQAPNVTVEEVSRGVWLLAGGSHHSAVVEFADHLMLIDAPQNDARTLAVIAKARELRPGKPLTHVVNSHHHFDHSGGIRAAVAEGLTVVTHEGNAAFIEEIVKRPHTRRAGCAVEKSEAAEDRDGRG